MKHALRCLLGAGLLVGAAGCATERDSEPQSDDDKDVMQLPPQQAGVDPGDDEIGPSATKPKPVVPPAQVPPSEPTDVQVPPATTLAKLVVATDCGDLLTKIQNDAVAKLKMQAELYKKQPPNNPNIPVRGGFADAGVATGSIGALPGRATDDVATPPPNAPLPSGAGGAGSVPSKDAAESAKPSNPTGASSTNTQVAGVDEADFVKVVDSGKGIFVLHGNTLRRLKSWPAAETALVGTPLVIEGSPNEMFVSEQGKAVIFSQVFGYPSSDPKTPAGSKPAIACNPFGNCYGGSNKLKITVADVSTLEPKVERELYYEGSYLSSRRYASPTGDVVRAVVQASSKSSGLYSPNIVWNDPWGRAYDKAEIASQLDEWERRTTAAIRKTTLEEWIPIGQEVEAGMLFDIEPDCDSYYVPDAGLSDYGLTHVLALDISQPMSPVGGVTIVGATSTVYSNASRMVLAQPDYRWSPQMDFGIANSQQTALHVFDLDAAKTKYVASGWVFGALPIHNPQFGIDVAKDGIVRVATTGRVRTNPHAKPEQPEFWQQSTESYVITAKVEGSGLAQVGQSPKLGKPGESVQSARFVDNRAYVVTFLQKDPLYVLDVGNPQAVTVLGEIEIPGFGYYLHPLDQNHLITAGESGTRSTQLQLFDTTDPKNMPPPKVLDFGAGSSSELSFNHKAVTFFDGYMALPVSSYGFFSGGRSQFSAGLQVVRVNAQTGFTPVASIDHARLYANNGAGVMCGVCDAMGCYDYACGYSPEVRRGHFVQGDGKTFVYSFSHAGVLVNDLAAPARPVASVGLPAPQFSSQQPWFGPDRLPIPTTGAMTPTTSPARPVPAVDGGAAMPIP
jgi:hypothetical protein